jgi:hypothetical protein
MTSERVPKNHEHPGVRRRTRGKVQPPAVRQSAGYWEEIFQRCLDEYAQTSGEKPRLNGHESH